jgi:uncharacterized protein YbaR (Trm112 family)
MDTMSQTIDPELLGILVCPESHAKLVLVGDWLYSTDPATRRRYPVRDGIPIMLIDDSEVVAEEEFQRIMQQAQQTESSTNGNG